MAFFGVRVRVRQDFDVIVSADSQAEAEALAATFRTSGDENILSVTKFGSEVSNAVGSQALSDTSALILKNAQNFVSNVVDDLKSLPADITSQEYADLKTQLINLRNLINTIKS